MKQEMSAWKLGSFEFVMGHISGAEWRQAYLA